MLRREPSRMCVFGLLTMLMFVPSSACQTQEVGTEPEDVVVIIDTPEVSEPIAEAVVGPDGGSLTFDGIQMVIPAGALSETRALSVSEVSEFSATQSEWLNDQATLYRFEPSGTEFDVPIVVELAFPAPSEYATEDEFRKANPAVLWADDGQLTFLPYELSSDGSGGWVVRVSNDRFSDFGFLSWTHINYAAWRAGKIAITALDVTGQALFTAGAVVMAGLCSVGGYGDANEEPCPGPKRSDGTEDELCLGVAFTGDVELRVCPTTGRCTPTSECRPCTGGSGSEAPNYCKGEEVCEAGRCEVPGPCGGRGEACCEGDEPCAGDLSCVGEPGANLCVICGGDAQSCCNIAGDFVCQEGLICNSSLECEQVVPCGGDSEACCEGDTPCDQDLSCKDGICTSLECDANGDGVASAVCSERFHDCLNVTYEGGTLEMCGDTYEADNNNRLCFTIDFGAGPRCPGGYICLRSTLPRDAQCCKPTPGGLDCTVCPDGAGSEGCME